MTTLAFIQISSDGSIYFDAPKCYICGSLITHFPKSGCKLSATQTVGETEVEATTREEVETSVSDSSHGIYFRLLFYIIDCPNNENP